MLTELTIALLLGIIVGSFTGLAPGVHINLVSVILLSISPVLLLYSSALSLAAFVMSMSITHTFLDTIPSIYLGAPDESKALSALPGHRMLLKGKAYAAVYLTIVGSLGGLILSILFIPFLFKIFTYLYPLISDYVGHFLLIIVVIMILRDKLKLWALFLFLLSGTLGLVVFSMPNLNEPLFPLLSGLFGISTLILSFTEEARIPRQDVKKPKIDKELAGKAIASSTFAGTLISFLPGLGPSQGAVVAQSMTKDLGDEGFLILIGGIGTVGMMISLVTLFVLEKARNGSVIAISKLIELSFQQFLILLAVSLVVGIICFFLTLYVARKFSYLITKVNYKLIISFVMLFVTTLVFILSGWIGLLILVTSTAIGLIAPLTGVQRSHAMGCLILPVILYFLI